MTHAANSQKRDEKLSNIAAEINVTIQEAHRNSQDSQIIFSIKHANADMQI